MKQKKPNKNCQISFYTTQEMKDFLDTQENISGYIRAAIQEKRDRGANPTAQSFASLMAENVAIYGGAK